MGTDRPPFVKSEINNNPNMTDDSSLGFYQDPAICFKKCVPLNDIL